MIIIGVTLRFDRKEFQKPVFANPMKKRAEGQKKTQGYGFTTDRPVI